MSKLSKPTVELAPDAARPSRIRREPPPPPGKLGKLVLPAGREREAWVVGAGVLMFALAITFLIFWISDYTSH